MTAAELRAITAQGPAVVISSREDMLRLLDSRESLIATLRQIADDLERGARFCSLMVLPDVICARQRALAAIAKAED